MNYSEQYQFRHANDEFWHRVEEAILIVASAIRSEDAGTANHAARLVWAKAAELDPLTKTNEMRNRITTHWLIQANGANVSDTTVGETPGLRQVIESLVDDFTI